VHVSLCAVNVTWIDLDLSAFILNFLTSCLDCGQVGLQFR
jgi:hypothetical protein